MENNFKKEYLRTVRETRSFREQLGTLLPIFSILVIAGVFWWLKLTGITMAGEAFCGFEEHTHNAECMTAVLLCSEIETSDDTDVPLLQCMLDEHEHTKDECMIRTLNCQDEHEHIDECYITEIICEKQEHIHEEACCTTETQAAHIHTESCYDISLTCEKDEHIHTSS